MGDRTYTEVVIGREFAELVDALISGETCPDLDGSEFDGSVKKYINYEANRGDIPWLEQLLEENYIPYDKTWADGCDYGPGTKCVRVREDDSDAEPVLEIRNLEDGEDLLAVEQLLSLFDSQGADAVHALLKEKRERMRPLEPKIHECEPSAIHDRLRFELRLNAAGDNGRKASDANLRRLPNECPEYKRIAATLPDPFDLLKLRKAWLKGFDEAQSEKPHETLFCGFVRDWRIGQGRSVPSVDETDFHMNIFRRGDTFGIMVNDGDTPAFYAVFEINQGRPAAHLGIADTEFMLHAIAIPEGVVVIPDGGPNGPKEIQPDRRWADAEGGLFYSRHPLADEAEKQPGTESHARTEDGERD